MQSPKLLIVEDDEAAIFGYIKYLSGTGYNISSATCLKDAKHLVDAEQFDGVVLDLNLPDGNAIDWISELRSNFEHLAIIITTGNSEISTAVQAMQFGADNYLTKPLTMSDLEISLQKCLEIETLRKKNRAYKRLSSKNKRKPYFGISKEIQKILEYAAVAAADTTIVLITGETGTGKGILARWIHDNSEWKSEEFVELNCSSLKGEILRSELFGHAKGSFTSAIKDHEGFIEIADGGTLFLDEIGDMDLAVQAQLLKTIEEKTYRRVGESKLRKSDFRLICATNYNLAKASENGSFRKDLYYRINVFPIQLPPLKERKEDIDGLVDYLLTSLGYSHFPLSPNVIEMLKLYDWPGNIRELRNMIERARLLAQGKPLDCSHFPGLETSASLPISQMNTWNIDKLEESHIITALKHFNNDKNRVCKELGISLASLYRKLDKLKQIS